MRYSSLGHWGQSSTRRARPAHPLRTPASPSSGGRWIRALSRGREAAAAGQDAERGPRLARLEAVLLLAAEPLSSRKLAQFAGLADGTEARTLVRGLNRVYDAQGTAFRVEEVAGGFQLLTRSCYGPWLRRLYQSPVETRLSSPALETLAVVAYRQPVLRADIEAIRGVQSGEILRQLMERDLVRITGRSPELGRPFLYGTTKRFLQVFGLRHLDELPRVEALRPPAAARAGIEASFEATGCAPAQSGAGDIPSPCQPGEESEVKIASLAEVDSAELVERSAVVWAQSRHEAVVAAKDDAEDEDWDDDEEDDLEDEEDDDLDDEDDLEEDEWEEVGDEDVEDEDLEDDEDEDWEDDEDDDWEDDEDEDWEEED